MVHHPVPLSGRQHVHGRRGSVADVHASQQQAVAALEGLPGLYEGAHGRLLPKRSVVRICSVSGHFSSGSAGSCSASPSSTFRDSCGLCDTARSTSVPGPTADSYSTASVPAGPERAAGRCTLSSRAIWAEKASSQSQKSPCGGCTARTTPRSAKPSFSLSSSVKPEPRHHTGSSLRAEV